MTIAREDPPVHPGDWVEVGTDPTQPLATLLKLEVLAVITVNGIRRPVVQFAMPSRRGPQPVAYHRLLWFEPSDRNPRGWWGSSHSTDQTLDEYLAEWDIVERRAA